ncbi:MAG TPA: CoA-transferase [Hyphomicrobiaceae bacterium]|nr:CoA-transferase [Hyphomicrobiaceae bacterium]
MSRKSKHTSLEALVERIPDGSSIGLGGSFLHRGPFAFCRELIRQGKKDLEIIKASPGYDLDILCRAGAVRRVRAGIVALEGNFGLAGGYRKAVESGKVELEEHACMTLVAGLRAAGAGVPFQPVGGVHGSQIAEVNGWKKIADPYGTNQETYLIPAIRPDFVVIHANEIDATGNARVFGSPHWDRAMSRAARTLFVTAEKLVETERFRERPELTLVPGFMVSGCCVIPNGAWPGSLAPDYSVTYDEVQAYVDDAERTIEPHMSRAPELKLKGSNHG